MEILEGKNGFFLALKERPIPIAIRTPFGA